jgi:hypothetical protein
MSATLFHDKDQGPRHDPEYPADRLDEPENLILLCRVHHKMVDDQHETYTVGVLSNIKVNHERWVTSALSGEPQHPPVRIRQIKENVPLFLIRLNSGLDVMAIAAGAYGSSFDHEEPRSNAEADFFGQFFQEVQDWVDVWEDVGPGEHVKASFGLSERLRELENAGFWVFGARETRRIEGGVGQPSPWPIAILRVVRSDGADITRLAPETIEQKTPKSSS